MKFKKKAIVIAIAILIIPITNVFANTITISHTAGTVYGSVSGSSHGTKYKETRVNYSGCANSAGEYSDYGDSQCAYLTTSNTVWVQPESGYGHYHLYVAFVGVPDGKTAGSRWAAGYQYDISQFPVYN
ncbi:MAG TPA: hypothetical protein DEO50_07480 [Erysipelotrichaceae bacterium]|nr:hypothetical protein [Erysipelotrichaceae bacterium]